jgi:glycosyltransferase involved in cell wall biosynthesis
LRPLHPLFTVITVTYNSAKFLDETIQSVLAQKYGDFELLIGDDNSTDETWQIIGRYSDLRIRKYRNEVNLGEYGNRTKAIQAASGRYILFIDGDDRMYPHALEVFQYYTRQFPESAMFFCREWDPRVLCPYVVDPVTAYRFEYLDGGIMGGNFTRVLFAADVLKTVSFPPGIRSGDTYIQLLIARDHMGVVIPSGLTWWRRRTGNATAELFKDNRHLTETIRYRLELLGPGCPLPPEEIALAETNVWGIYLRMLLRIFLSGKFSDFIHLSRHLKVPVRHWFSFFKPSNYNYFAGISGDKPLHTVIFNGYKQA